MKIKTEYTNVPQWRELHIKSCLPASLNCLDEMAHNIWWTWNYEAREMWKSLDEKLYDEVGQNPVLLLERLSYGRKQEVAADKETMKRINSVYRKFREYMDVEVDKSRPSVAYFSMEYGLNQVLKIYSGGLGMLAGDYLKEASDSNVDLCAIGFLYRFGYFRQSLGIDGQQIANYEAQNFNTLPLVKQLDENGDQLVIDVPYMDYVVHAYVWRVNVGRIALYLLDTDNEMNSEYDRAITHTLYGGDWENRLKQEILLGIGGMLMLERMGMEKDVYHCNEGHAALCNLQRLCDYIEAGMTFNQAIELVRASALYTVHTPVPAGHDYFDEELFGKYMRGYADKLGITWEEFIGMGRTNADDKDEKFCMSTFACNTCQEVNGVSKLHGWVSQKMFANNWKGFFPEENHVGYVTNGVHFPTWAATEWRKLYQKYFDEAFLTEQSNEKIWQAIYEVPDAEIWQTRLELKRKLINYIREKFSQTWLQCQGDPSRVMSLLERINSNALIIGFCRRFATYKRAHLLFTDLERLSKIVNNPGHPVQFIFSGKAHPADGAGQGLIKRIYEISQRPEFLGKILFLEDYDFSLARRLVSGVDVWMNTPTRPLEASGTSGEKAEMNGVVNLSVLDGWWYEGYRAGAGWAVTEKQTYDNQVHQDQLDAATIYGLLENEIIPLYYDRNEQGFSEGWIKVIKNSIAQIAPHYTMKRQLDDYYYKFYEPLAKRSAMLAAEDAKKAKEIAQWKENVAQHWDMLRVIHRDDEFLVRGGDIGSKATLRYTVSHPGVQPDDIQLELVLTYVRPLADEHQVAAVVPFEHIHTDGHETVYEAIIWPHVSGNYRGAVRIVPRHRDLPHRQDFAYVKWIE